MVFQYTQESDCHLYYLLDRGREISEYFKWFEKKVYSVVTFFFGII